MNHTAATLPKSTKEKNNLLGRVRRTEFKGACSQSSPLDCVRLSFSGGAEGARKTVRLQGCVIEAKRTHVPKNYLDIPAELNCRS